MKRWLLASAVLFLLTGAAFAAEPVKSKEPLFNKAVPPAIKNIPILSTLGEKGARLFYLGERSGLHGWFVLLNGQVQVVYTTPDNKTALIGALFTANGDTVSTEQIKALAQTDRGFATSLELIMKERAEAMQGQAAQGQAAQEKAVGAEAPATITPFIVPKEDPKLPEKTEAKPEEKKQTASAGDLLLQDMDKAVGVTLGKNDKARLMMVIEPHCPHCKSVWAELKDAVVKNNLQVKLIPIAFPEGEAEREAAQLIASADPLTAWTKYAAGDKAVLAGTPDEAKIKAVRSNYGLSNKWNIKSTPYIAYRGKDGRVKIVLGKPDQISAVLSDLVD